MVNGYAVKGRRESDVLKGQVIKFEIFQLLGPLPVPIVLTPKNQDWSGVIHRLFDLRIDQWEAEYYDPCIVDGTRWTLLVQSSELKIQSEGCNAYPPHFDEVRKLIESAATSAPAQTQTYTRKPSKCPNCGDAPVANILYGMPSISADLLAKEERGEMIFGGCVIEMGGSQPRWKCSKCGEEFYNSAN